MEGRKDRLTVFCFFFLGEGINFPALVVIWMAVQDILAGTFWASSAVILTFSIPEIISKVFSPYIINRISFRSAFALLTLFYIGSYVLLLTIDDVRIRIAGVGGLGVAFGFSSIAAVRMLSYYEHADVCASAFQNGHNAAVFVASLLYTGLTTWICLAPRIALALCIPLCFVPLVIYFLLDKEPLKDRLRKSTDRQSVKYTALNDEDHCTDNINAPTEISQQNFNMWVFFKAFPFMGYTYVSNFCTHFMVIGVLSTVSFKSSPFPPRDHFQYYRFMDDVGCLFGGVVNLFFSCFQTKWTEFFRIRRIWVLVLLNVFHLMFFVFASWYHFLPNVIVVLVMCFTRGIIQGLTLIQCAVNASNTFTSASDKGTALGMMEIGLSVGRVAAALLGTSTEKLLREHCTGRLLLGRFCLTRHASRAEWSKNLSCKVLKL